MNEVGAKFAMLCLAPINGAWHSRAPGEYCHDPEPGAYWHWVLCAQCVLGVLSIVIVYCL